ncbi:ZIP family metal transporter [Phaeodactylibacter luteus]|uniref:ZIP family metal transporter n=1 Tax=Phaeodactylibacter luteus TaxID=1564516 RepID=A0A5C6RJW0_9BACT|nr:ZIP family metal transporter [Phaeodactylibacter luteus]TXB62706.1 ZIP family metal transporter [Phaeodactylibacter luteus]
MEAITTWISGFSPAIQALVATLFTWGVTALGAGLVFFFRKIHQKALDSMLGMAAGVMIAASFWSLLAPAIAMTPEVTNLPEWLPALIGFVSGALFIAALDRVLPHLHIGGTLQEAEGIPTNWRRSILLVLAITLHNIPEGLAVGVAFGAVVHGLPSATIGAAVALAIGIGLQNFPEGASVSVPLRREGMSRRKAFFYGQASGVVEPIFGVLGAVAVLTLRPVLPFALSFAAGAMIFVVVEELIPEAHRNGNQDLVSISVIGGFSIMMVLDVALG